MNAPAKPIGVRELRGRLSEVLRRVAAGESFLVQMRGRTVAELRAMPQEGTHFREAGALRGKLWIAEDFDTLPDDVLDAVEGDLPDGG